METGYPEGLIDIVEAVNGRSFEGVKNGVEDGTKVVTASEDHRIVESGSGLLHFLPDGLSMTGFRGGTNWTHTVGYTQLLFGLLSVSYQRSTSLGLCLTSIQL